MVTHHIVLEDNEKQVFKYPFQRPYFQLFFCPSMKNFFHFILESKSIFALVQQLFFYF